MRKVLTLVVDYEDGTGLPERAASLLVTAGQVLVAEGWASDDGAMKIQHYEVSVSGGETGAERIAAERVRQVTREGWTAEHDDRHTLGELTAAAICYAARANGTSVMTPVLGIHGVPALWPWEQEMWKAQHDPVRDLEKAGASIAAEIDRLERRKRGNVQSRS